ncbi:hypothetical protein EDD95_5640 [Streptomyces sp. CEV 2-1]|nr:hypothetical protein EDD95_5640 [Streptomyces sp. CEV 2-1]
MPNARRSIFISALAACLLSAPATMTTASAADSCKTWASNSGMTGNVKCTGANTATRQHRAVVTCFNDGGGKWKITGNWAYPDVTSSAICSTSGHPSVASITYERRNKG